MIMEQVAVRGHKS